MDFRPYSRREMDDADYRRLPSVVEAMSGKVVLSGYPSCCMTGPWRAGPA